MSTVDNPNSVMYVPPLLRAARRLVFQMALSVADDTIALEQIATINMGQSPKGSACSSTPEGAPLLNGPTEFGDIHPTPVQWTTEPRKWAEPGDLLFCVRGATAGRTNWADQTYAIGRGLCAIRGKPNRGDTQFVYHILRDRRDALADQAHGSTFMNLSKQELHRLAVPSMPVEMQQRLGMFLSEVEQEQVNYQQWANTFASTPFDDLVRIVARIEALAGRVAEAQRLRVEAIGEVEALLASVMHNEITSTKDAKTVALEDTCELIVDCLHSTPRYSDEGIPTVRSPDVGWGTLDLDSARFTNEDEYANRTRRGEPQTDDIIFVREGGGVGKAAIVLEGQKFSLGQRTMMMRPNQAIVLPKFFLYQLLSPAIYQDQILERLKGSASPHLNIGTLRQFDFLVPSLEEQRTIVNKLDHHRSQIDGLRQYQAATQAELDALLPAILDQAFRGEL